MKCSHAASIRRKVHKAAEALELALEEYMHCEDVDIWRKRVCEDAIHILMLWHARVSDSWRQHGPHK